MEIPRSLKFFTLVVLVFVVGLFASVLYLPIGYTYRESCPSCGGEGKVTCEVCHGSGKCPICGGDGVIDYMPPGSQWCAACQGTGKCYRCGGKGWHLCEECGGTGFLVHWMYTLAGATIVSSTINILLFLGIFYIAYIVTELQLSFNEWVYKVENMSFWFNPSFWTWLYAKHRKKWIKWGTVIDLIVSSLIGAFIFCIISINKITQTIFTTGILLGAVTLSVFSLLFYKMCTLELESKSLSTS